MWKINPDGSLVSTYGDTINVYITVEKRDKCGKILTQAEFDDEATARGYLEEWATKLNAEAENKL